MLLSPSSGGCVWLHSRQGGRAVLSGRSDHLRCKKEWGWVVWRSDERHHWPLPRKLCWVHHALCWLKPSSSSLNLNVELWRWLCSALIFFSSFGFKFFVLLRYYWLFIGLALRWFIYEAFLKCFNLPDYLQNVLCTLFILLRTGRISGDSEYVLLNTWSWSSILLINISISCL